ncbi:MAG: hypothetical protein RBQ97_10555, partial [Acholeplasma sp.]|nr:hypothetical protein [Acholeplasma sp.]
AAIWTEQTKLDLFPQAGVFVKKSLETSKVLQYIEDIEIATNKANDNPSLIANYCESLDYPFEKIVIESSIKLSQIDFQSHLHSRDIINEYLNLIIDFKSELIGNQLPDNDFYYPLS